MNILKPQVSTNLSDSFSVAFVHFSFIYSMNPLLIYFIKNIVHVGLNTPAF